MDFFSEVLQASITRSESKPEVKLTEQKQTEASIIFHSATEVVLLWFCVLLHFHTYADLKTTAKRTPINLIKIGRLVNYRDDQDRLLLMSRWGKTPPKTIKAWLDTHYGMYRWIFSFVSQTTCIG